MSGHDRQVLSPPGVASGLYVPGGQAVKNRDEQKQGRLSETNPRRFKYETHVIFGIKLKQKNEGC